ncbi:hypothetical protein H311_02139 [Anncaliia algerae PRA109]|nr:hypothetical protein H311_02139 [Anncaliia algerae PRA109]
MELILKKVTGVQACAIPKLLRKRHNLNEFWYGIDSEKIIGDMRENYIYEPVEVKRNIIRTSFAAVIALIQIDMTILTRARTE